MRFYQNLQLVLLVLLFINSTDDLSAQTNFHEGYYVDIQGDTINGLIEFRFEKRNSMICSFKKTSTSPKIKMKPNEIKAYGIKDKSRYISIEHKNKQFFFKILFDGKFSLLTLPNQKTMIFPKPEYFILDNSSSKLFELSPPNEILEINGTKYLNSDGYTRGLLKALMSEQAEIHQMIDGATNIYQVDILKNILTNYHNRKNIDYKEYDDVKLNPHISLDLNLGVGLQKMRFRDIQSLKINGNNVNLGFSTFIFLPKINENIHVTYSLNYSKNDYYTFFQNNNVKNDVILEYGYLEHSVGLRFKHLTKFSINFDINFVSSMPINKSVSWRRETLSQSIVTTENVTNQEVLADRYLGLSFNIGKDLNLYRTAKINLFFKYTHSETNSSNSSITTAGVGMKFYLIN